jgi:putative phage-type endonuclease
MITERQRIERRNHIGSSDVSALFTDTDGNSLNPFATALDIWCEKYYNVEPLDVTEAMARGNRYESVLIQFARDELHVDIDADPERMNFICEDHPVFACNLDGFGYDGKKRFAIEAKTTSLADEWGEPGTDQVPYTVMLQVHHQMLCANLDRAYIAALLGGFRLREEIFIVDRDERIINAIIETGEKFWRDHVLTGIPPEQSQPGNVDLFKRIVRVPDTYAEVPDDIIAAWEAHKRMATEMKKATDVAFAEVLKHLGDAEGAHMADGRTLTYFEQNGAARINRTELKEVYPAVYEAVTSPNRYRVARIKKAR